MVVWIISVCLINLRLESSRMSLGRFEIDLIRWIVYKLMKLQIESSREERAREKMGVPCKYSIRFNFLLQTEAREPNPFFWSHEVSTCLETGRLTIKSVLLSAMISGIPSPRKTKLFVHCTVFEPLKPTTLKLVSRHRSGTSFTRKCLTFYPLQIVKQHFIDATWSIELSAADSDALSKLFPMPSERENAKRSVSKSVYK